MKYNLPILLLILIITSSSCSIHNGQLINLDHGQSSTEKNKAYGYAKASYFMGIGGLNSNVLMLEAKNNLLENRPLLANESYKNVTVNSNKFIFWPYIKKSIIISADIENPQIETISNIPFSIGDTVFSSSLKYKGIYLGKNYNKVFVKKLTKNKRLKIKTLKRNEIFSLKGKLNNISVGEKVKILNVFKDGYDQAEVIAVGINLFIAKKENSEELLTVKLDEIKK